MSTSEHSANRTRFHENRWSIGSRWNTHVRTKAGSVEAIGLNQPETQSAHCWPFERGGDCAFRSVEPYSPVQVLWLGEPGPQRGTVAATQDNARNATASASTSRTNFLTNEKSAGGRCFRSGQALPPHLAVGLDGQNSFVAGTSIVVTRFGM